jgi:hypothetical protein
MICNKDKQKNGSRAERGVSAVSKFGTCSDFGSEQTLSREEQGNLTNPGAGLALIPNSRYIYAEIKKIEPH